MTNAAHPLESVLGLEPGSTFGEEKKAVPNTALLDPSTGQEVARTDLPSAEELEREERLEDLAIDTKLERVHVAAIDAFEKQARLADEVDPRFAARNAEVAAQYLKIALDSVNSRVDSKYKRQKVKIAKKDIEEAKKKGGGGTVLIADRNAILRALGGQPAEEKEVKGETFPMEPSE